MLCLWFRFWDHSSLYNSDIRTIFACNIFVKAVCMYRYAEVLFTEEKQYSRTRSIMTGKYLTVTHLKNKKGLSFILRILIKFQFRRNMRLCGRFSHLPSQNVYYLAPKTIHHAIANLPSPIVYDLAPKTIHHAMDLSPYN
jgi:hypothetical protein